MSDVTVTVPAKINLRLAVGDLRPDGFHDLLTVFHAISLHDKITVSERGGGLTITGEGAGIVSTGLDNLAWRAARALAAHIDDPDRVDGLKIVLDKAIPVAGGMAGGSADAAGTLLALRKLWQLDVTDAELATIAARLGSDIPFMLIGRTALGKGRGENLTPVPVATTLHWVVAVDTGALSTPVVFAKLDKLRAQGHRDDAGPVEPLLAALAEGNVPDIAKWLGNDLQAPALCLRPSLADTLDAGLAAGALAGVVSGSGPTCVFLAADATEAGVIADHLTRSGVCRDALVATGEAAVA